MTHGEIGEDTRLAGHRIGVIVIEIDRGVLILKLCTFANAGKVTDGVDAPEHLLFESPSSSWGVRRGVERSGEGEVITTKSCVKVDRLSVQGADGR